MMLTPVSRVCGVEAVEARAPPMACRRRERKSKVMKERVMVRGAMRESLSWLLLYMAMMRERER
jgi:hypothetical protein